MHILVCCHAQIRAESIVHSDPTARNSLKQLLSHRMNMVLDSYSCRWGRMDSAKTYGGGDRGSNLKVSIFHRLLYTSAKQEIFIVMLAQN